MELDDPVRAMQIAATMVVNLLGAGAYQLVENLNSGHGLDAKAIQAGVESLGVPLVERTPSLLLDLDPKEVDEGRAWESSARLWLATGLSRSGVDLRFEPTDYATLEVRLLGFRELPERSVQPEALRELA